ncbi:MAG: hypothetical protein HY319_08925 [Armatimonadetes bacterium]|nr:hypothetical protein [Armatimonadota bacterium]
MRRRAFSLAEAVIASFLIFLILGVAATLVQGYSRVMRDSSGKERTHLAAQLALERVRAEVASAIEVLDPTAGSNTELKFDKLDPRAARLPDPLPDPLPADWEPWEPADRITVRYFIDGGNLMREASGPGGAVVETITRGIEGFLVTVEPPGSLDITVTVREDRRVVTFTTKANLEVLQ